MIRLLLLGLALLAAPAAAQQDWETVKYATDYPGGDLGAQINSALNGTPLGVPVIVNVDGSFSSTVASTLVNTEIRCVAGSSDGQVNLTRTSNVPFFNVQAAGFRMPGCVLDGSGSDAALIAYTSAAVRMSLAGSRLRNGTGPYVDGPTSRHLNLHGGLVDAAIFGCLGNGTADDTLCFDALDRYAFNRVGLRIEFGGGAYRTRNGWRTGQDNIWTGLSRNSALVTAITGYSASDPMVSIDCPNPDNCHGGRVEWMDLNGGGITEIGIYSNRGQEESGASHVGLYGFAKHGVKFEGTVQNYRLEHILGAPGSNMQAGYYIDANHNADPPRQFGPFSIVPTADLAQDRHAIRIKAANSVVLPVHSEMHGIGVHLTGSNQFLTAIDHRGQAPCAVEVDGVALIGVVHRPPTNGGCQVYSAMHGRSWYTNPTGTQEGAFNNLLSIGHNNLGEGTLIVNAWPSSAIPSDIELYRPQIGDSLDFAPKDDPPTCTAVSGGTRGTIYFDASLDEWCGCAGGVYRQLDGGGSGTASSCG